jgi:hypothetical protein
VRRFHFKWVTVRDTLLFTTGLVGTIHETFFEVNERSVLLGVFAAMMGLSGAFRLSSIRKEAYRWHRTHQHDENGNRLGPQHE